MLSKNERIIVEAIRNSPVLEITIPENNGNTYITIRSKKTCHDVALAIQSYFANKNNSAKF